MVNWITGKITKIKFWTDRLFSLNIKAPVCQFIAGQFTKLRVEINGKYIQRAYSYVNAPDDPILEFYIVIVQGGKLSPHLSSLSPGDKIQIEYEASGSFIIEGIPKCETLWMLSTGTAIGPYLSILEDGRDLDRFKNIVLVHAVRYASDLSYHLKIAKLKKHYGKKLHIQTVVSREKIANALTGRIPSLIESGALESTVGLPIDTLTSHIMLCGNPEMVRDTQELLISTRKMKKNLYRQPGHITSERYW